MARNPKHKAQQYCNTVNKDFFLNGEHQNKTYLKDLFTNFLASKATNLQLWLLCLENFSFLLLQLVFQLASLCDAFLLGPCSLLSKPSSPHCLTGSCLPNPPCSQADSPRKWKEEYRARRRMSMEVCSYSLYVGM